MEHWDSMYQAHRLVRNNARREDRPAEPDSGSHGPRHGLADYDNGRLRRDSDERLVSANHTSSSNALIPANHANRRHVLLPAPLVHPTNNVTVVVNVFDKDGAKQVLNTLPNIVSSSHPGAAKFSVAPVLSHAAPSYSMPAPAAVHPSSRPARFSRAPSPPCKHEGKRKYEYVEPSDTAKRQRAGRIVEVVEDPPQLSPFEMDPSGWRAPSDEGITVGGGVHQSASRATLRQPTKRSESEVARYDEEEVELLCRQATVQPERNDQRVRDNSTADLTSRRRQAPTPMPHDNPEPDVDSELLSPPSSEHDIPLRSAQSRRYLSLDNMHTEGREYREAHTATVASRSRPASRVHGHPGDTRKEQESGRLSANLVVRDRFQADDNEPRRREPCASLPTPRASVSIHGRSPPRSPYSWVPPVAKEGGGSSTPAGQPSERGGEPGPQSVLQTQVPPMNDYSKNTQPERFAHKLPHGRVFCRYCYPQMQHLRRFPRGSTIHLKTGCPKFKQSPAYRSKVEKGWPHRRIVHWALEHDKAMIVEISCRNDPGYLAQLATEYPGLTPKEVERQLEEQGAKLCKDRDCSCCPDLSFINRYLSGLVTGEPVGHFTLGPVGSWQRTPTSDT
ncbi:hypothetical protein OH77DRAFT_936792 [Trametes cingulata]|nr:hypothetical protein OH77DRAFT_936792 [Trametes cingulata]